jgi:hypothetical protein
MPKKSQALDEAVDLLAEAQFFGERLTRSERDRLARFIASRQGGVGAYADSFALTDSEKAEGIRVFTGERMTSASARHIIGEEAARALRQLKGAPTQVKAAVRAADTSMRIRIAEHMDAEGHPGVF